MIDPELSNELKQFFKHINDERSKPVPPPSRYAFLNSPFIVTVMGGLVLSILTLTIQERASTERELTQQRAANEREQNARIADMREKKHTMMSDFAYGMTLYLQCAPAARTRGIFIEENMAVSDKSGLKFADERNWSETVVRHETCLAELNKLKCPDAYCAQAAAIFDDESLLAELHVLDALMDQYAVTGNLEEFVELAEKASVKLQEVIALMGVELKQMK